MLTLSGKTHAETAPALADTHRQIADLLREMPTATAPEVAQLGLIGTLQQAVGEELGSAFDDVTWEVKPEAERRARAIPPLTADVSSTLPAKRSAALASRASQAASNSQDTMLLHATPSTRGLRA